MKRRTVSLLSLLILLVMAFFLFLFMRSQASFNQAEEEAVRLVSYDHDISAVNYFYWTTTDGTYFSLDFTDGEGQDYYAIIAQDGGEVSYYTHDDLISKEDALSITLNDKDPYELMQVRLGLFEEKPVWEVTIKNDNDTISYYYLNAKNGQWVQSIENI